MILRNTRQNFVAQNVSVASALCHNLICSCMLVLMMRNFGAHAHAHHLEAWFAASASIKRRMRLLSCRTVALINACMQTSRQFQYGSPSVSTYGSWSKHRSSAMEADKGAKWGRYPCKKCCDCRKFSTSAAAG